MNGDSYFVCYSCGRVLRDLSPPGSTEAEAAAAFTPEELADAVSYCDDCWHGRRAADPEFDARYGRRT